MTKMQPYTNEWHDIAAALQRSFAPDVYPCEKCGYPVIEGHCCSNCGSIDPHDAEAKSLTL